MTIHKFFWRLAIVGVLMVSAVGAFGSGGVEKALGATSSWSNLTYTAAAAANPMKGVYPYASDTAPYGFSNNNGMPFSMVHYYIPLNQVVTGQGQYDWSQVETRLNNAQTAGLQAVLRFYVDYPGYAYAMPAYLANTVSKTAYTDYGNSTSYMPNYDDPNFLSMMDAFVSAFGTKYDGDVRIGAIEIGIFGFWGEWHTYQPSCSCDTHMPNATDESRLLNDFDSDFHKTKIMVRYPMPSVSPAPSSQPMGYHDDSFAYATIMQDSSTNWYFTGRMSQYGGGSAWQNYPIGGEVYPGIQSCIWTTTLSDASCTNPGQDWNDSVNGTHLSFVMDDHAFSGSLTSTEKANGITAQQKMGYEYYVSSADLYNLGSSDPFQVDVKIRNTGVAPFYYNWPVQVRVKGPTNATWTTPWQIAGLQPGAGDTEFSFSQSNPGLSAGTYTLEMSVPNPMSTGLPLRFADTTQDQTDSGWLTLGTFTVSANGTPAPTSTPTNTNTPAPATSTPTNTSVPPTATNTPTGGVVYEANASGNTLAGGAAASACSSCLDGYDVGYVGEGGTLTINNVSASSAGTYNMTIYYLDGDSGRSATVQANGGTGTNINFPGTGSWTTVGTYQTTVTLNAGSSNTIEFSNASAYAPDFDHLVIFAGSGPTNTPTNTPAAATNTPTKTNTPTNTPAAATSTPTNTPPAATNTPTKTNTPAAATNTPTNTPVPATATPTNTPSGSGTSYEAESASNTLYGSAGVVVCTACSGGNEVGYIGYGDNNGYLVFNGVNVSSTGSHTVTVYYTSDAARTFNLTINGAGSPQYTNINAASTGGFNTTPSSVQVTVSLTSGSNTIKVSNSSTLAPYIDRIVVN